MEVNNAKIEESSENRGRLGAEIREQLVDSMQDIASSVSLERFSEILCEKVSKELYDQFQTIFFQRFLSHVDDIERDARELNIEQQMRELRTMSSEYPEDHIAWRPTTGMVNINSIKANTLKARKKELLAKIESVDSENEILRQTIISKRKVLEEQTKNLRNIDIGNLMK